MSTDKIYAGDGADSGPFEFNASVADVFPDMLRRSIPGYAATLQAIGSLAQRYVVADSRCYDLGCSLGAATQAMRKNVRTSNCRIIAVDAAPAMIGKCREILAAEPADAETAVVEADIREVEIKNASMVVMNYTLQFLPVGERTAMMQKIYDGMRPGGVFVLSEKVADDDPGTESLLVDLHHEFKRRNSYSDLEISRKRAALENVLVSDTEAQHRQRLRDVGFEQVGVWLRYFNFISIVATKRCD